VVISISTDNYSVVYDQTTPQEMSCNNAVHYNYAKITIHCGSTIVIFLRNDMPPHRTLGSVISAVSLTPQSASAYEKSQATSQTSECGNEFMPTNIGCQDTESQIQGDEKISNFR